jgi:fatty-acyl-CoA synthase
MSSPDAPRTFIEAFRSVAARSDKGFTFLDEQQRPHFLSFAGLLVAAERRGQRLRAMGLRPGDRVALIIPDNREFVVSFLAAVVSGMVPVPMYPPASLRRLEAYVDTIGAVLAASGARLLLTVTAALPLAEHLGRGTRALPLVIALDALDALDAREVDDGALDYRAAPDDTCFLQYTSGSTSTPKGVVVTHANIMANSRAIMHDGLHADPERDCGLSWLPLYHDMGLIGFVLAPLATGVPVVFLQTLSFMKRPQLWLQCISRYRATISFAPNFAFALCLRLAVPGEHLDLSSLRALGCGAEPIQAGVIREFMARFASAGLDPNAFMACYGMAEATLAIAFERLSLPLQSASLDARIYHQGGRAMRAAPGEGSLEIVACGGTFPGHEIAIADAQGTLVPEGHVGQILFRGPSAAREYFEDPASTAQLWRDGWLQTGDLGFIQEGRLYVSGRLKDVIIHNGRNYYPHDIEWHIERMPQLRAGCTAAFNSDDDGTGGIVIVAEARSTESRAQVIEAVRAEVQRALGLAVDEVVFVPIGGLPKTTSGKVQRRRARELYRTGNLRRDAATAA